MHKIGKAALAVAVVAAAAALPPAAAAPGGRPIAYIRQSREIRLIAPDGSGDRRVWAHPQPDTAGQLGITSISWRPDGGELAFSSGHEAAISLHSRDIYGIRADGSNMRKITNPPMLSELGRFPKGTIRITVRNDATVLSGNSGVFIVVVVGAAEPQSVTLPIGASRTLTFTNVADFGNVVQLVVAMFGKFRWFGPGADVRAGATVQGETFGITGERTGVEGFGFDAPSWRSDGRQIGYILTPCVGVWRSPVTSPPGKGETTEMRGVEKTCVWDWGPGNQILYAGYPGLDDAIYRIREDGTSRTKLLQVESGLVTGLAWLKDGSGFLYSWASRWPSENVANVYRYDFATKRATQLTRFTREGEMAAGVTPSPDGQSAAFERIASLEENTKSDVWVMRLDGSALRLLVRNAHAPVW